MYQKFSYFFYFPLFNFSYDYDFRNWQSIELLEDSFWESNFSLYFYDEYLNLFTDFYESFANSKHSFFFDLEQNTLPNQFNDTANWNFDFAIYFDEFLVNPQLLKNEKFSVFPLLNNLSNLDDTYETLKNSTFSSLMTNNVFLNTTRVSDLTRSYLFIANALRSDYEELSWDTDFIDSKQSPQSELPFTNQKYLDTPEFNSELNNDNTTRFDNPIHLRDTTKNAIVTYNALQKVFRTRFDEGRSNTKLLEFANFYEKQPYLSSSRVLFEKTLGKTKNPFYRVNFYKSTTEFNLNIAYVLNTSLNYYIYDFPFLLANKSDASRHVWFDWFTKWGFYEVQPSSSARYAIHGMPHFNRFFNFTSNQNETLNETESYLLRLSKARKNYLPNWAYTPYFYAKNNLWYKNNLFFHAAPFCDKLTKVELHLDKTLEYSNILKMQKNTIFFNPSVSNMNSYSKNLWKPFSGISAYSYNMSKVFDILTRREFLYRQFLLKKNKIVNLPNYAMNSPKNELVLNIKSLFAYSDPIIFNNEYSREYYYNSLNLFNLYYVQNIFNSNNLIAAAIKDFFIIFLTHLIQI